MSNKNHDKKKWLQIAGILSEAEDDEGGEDIFGDEADAGEEDTAGGDTEEAGDDEGAGAEEEAGDEEEAEEEEEDTEEKEEKEDEEVEVDSTPTFDTELDKMFSDFEETATITAESTSLTRFLLEKEKRFDIVAFTDNVARVVNNFTSLVDYEKVVVAKAEKYLKDNHDDEAANMFKELIADRHGIDVADPPSADDETPIYSVGAVGGGE